ncbi:TetR/AcrR family transcriptional regulator [Microbacterium sp. cf332]|uniref:TetR/AcrR family transcriptional regulator n=1 Tax=Microbacterium sp. cf332 TaxID=1761804 RepID=UPI000888E6D8|nr:TetR/AcrR family transcriptional regulator [Microbacterium sp. cf332]SDQ48988.1 transcriptional regulator, TetR family [Microbacterium sp. cf332]
MPSATKTPRTTARGPYAKSARTRTLILDAAFAVFAGAGYRSGSLREIAERVDMSEAGLLHHFRNKAELLLAVLDHRDELARAQFEFGAHSGRESLADLVALADYNATIPGVIELFCTLSAESTSPDHPAHDYFRRRYEQSRQIVVDALSVIAADGGLRTGVDIASAAARSIAVWDGLQIQWLLDRSTLDMADELRACFDEFLLDALPAPRRTPDA